MEELNAIERKLYRPIWNRLLPPLDTPGKRGRRGISNVRERIGLFLESDQPGSIASMIRMGVANANSLRESNQSGKPGQYSPSWRAVSTANASNPGSAILMLAA